MASLAKPAEPVFSRVIVPVGGQDREFLAQEQAVYLAASVGVPVVGLHVSTSGVAPASIWQFLEETAKRWQVHVECHVLLGNSVAPVLLEELDIGDLTVIGSERMELAHRVGSIANALLRDAKGPVLVVRLES